MRPIAKIILSHREIHKFVPNRVTTPNDFPPSEGQDSVPLSLYSLLYLCSSSLCSRSVRECVQVLFAARCASKREEENDWQRTKSRSKGKSRVAYRLYRRRWQRWRCGSHEPAWWEASIKVSGRLIVIQSGGRPRYQFPVTAASFLSCLFSSFSLSHSLRSSSFFLVFSAVFLDIFLLPRAVHRWRQLSALSRRTKKRSWTRGTRRRERNRRRDAARRRRSTRCVPPRAKLLSELRSYLASYRWWTREIDSVLATTFQTDPRLPAGHLNNRGQLDPDRCLPRGGAEASFSRWRETERSRRHVLFDHVVVAICLSRERDQRGTRVCSVSVASRVGRFVVRAWTLWDSRRSSDIWGYLEVLQLHRDERKSTMESRWNGMFRRAGSVLLATLFVVSRVKSEEKESSLSPTAAMVSVFLCVSFFWRERWIDLSL